MSTSKVVSTTNAAMIVSLEVTDPNAIAYLAAFEDDGTRCERANEALKVGVIAIQSASPTLDTTVVQHKFTELEGRMKDYLDEFMTAVRDDMATYFKEHDGVLPKSIDKIFGDDGRLGRVFQGYFDPSAGKLGLLMQQQIGPTSAFGRSLDPKNKECILNLIEGRVQALVETKLDELLGEFSLDNDTSAMSRLQKLLAEAFAQIHQSLGIKSAIQAESDRGHVKGIEFEADLYPSFAALGQNLGDETDFVRGTIGATSRCKKGDYLATLGESAGAPGAHIVVEVKDSPMRFRAAVDELQEAKANRQASIGIFVFARGSEPPEVGDFRRVGEDFFCTVDKESLRDGGPNMFLTAAYTIARAMIVANTRKAMGGELNLAQIETDIEALALWCDRVGEMVTKARSLQSSGKAIEEAASELHKEMDTRLNRILITLRSQAKVSAA
jgi:hypothetical protein